VVVTIATEPEGVRVVVGGQERGKTPIDVELPRGDEPVDVQLLSPGFASARQQIVPDRDQRLYFQLIKQQKTIVRVKRPPAPEQGSGFRRFD
jgi:eukaryotic-like serine/threonine-protein kinase